MSSRDREREELEQREAELIREGEALLRQMRVRVVLSALILLFALGFPIWKIITLHPEHVDRPLTVEEAVAGTPVERLPWEDMLSVVSHSTPMFSGHVEGAGDVLHHVFVVVKDATMFEKLDGFELVDGGFTAGTHPSLHTKTACDGSPVFWVSGRDVDDGVMVTITVGVDERQ